ncbi:XisH family protein [filamentous cyanobacterium LEGE 11480]|uniref:XisH family protein n=1 Tax=Romeriopsis navalis LEGE 11480 TaxID=2777977 RepID=A0A928VQJ4_9CYAN|nr:element excision factor XisH family protein [Romeriopsis navalis]MBE9032670.1 XisH family protein [Romeriopsis navalis LEGE 11480]
MSRKDLFHELVKQALSQAGWTITADPLYLSVGNLNIQIDLAAEPLIAAVKADQKIAVEVKSFISASKITDFYGSLGQYLTYQVALRLKEPDRQLYLAVPNLVYYSLFQEVLVREVLQTHPVKLIIYDKTTQEIQSWIN